MIINHTQKTKKLLIVGWGWPEPDATAAGTRMLQVLSFFKRYSFEITFVSTAIKNHHSNYLEELGIATKQIFLNCDSFDEFINSLQPSVVLFDRFLSEEQFGWRVAEQIPTALKILDTEDLHSLRHVREQCFKANLPFAIPTWLGDDKTKREIASIYRCDLSLIISEYEMELLTTILGSNKNLLYHLPFMLSALDVPSDTPSFDDRMDFMFIGGGKHTPNIDAIKYLKDTIWPQIRKILPKSKLKIYGAYLPQQILELHNVSNGFHVLGKAAHVQDVMKNARVCLVPLRFGAGIKGKLLHAMQFGTPTVTTKIGAEGMHKKMEWNGSIADNEDDFINSAVHLYTNKTAWFNAQKNGYNLISSLYDKNILENKLNTRIDVIKNDLEKHRNQNFIGSLLLHQTMASTKYMSRWIQEKNK